MLQHPIKSTQNAFLAPRDRKGWTLYAVTAGCASCFTYVIAVERVRGIVVLCVRCLAAKWGPPTFSWIPRANCFLLHRFLTFPPHERVLLYSGVPREVRAAITTVMSVHSRSLLQFAIASAGQLATFFVQVCQQLNCALTTVLFRLMPYVILVRHVPRVPFSSRPTWLCVRLRTLGRRLCAGPHETNMPSQISNRMRTRTYFEGLA